MSIMARIIDQMNAPLYEPRKRLVGGSYGWAKHRFPIKNGISFRETMLREMYAGNKSAWHEMFERLTKP